MPERPADRLPRTLRRDQLRQLVPLADTTIYEMEQRGDFPRRFALTSRCVVWDLAEVEAWLAARKATPVPRAQHPDVHSRPRHRSGRPILHHVTALMFVLSLVVDAARGAAVLVGEPLLYPIAIEAELIQQRRPRAA